MKSMKYGNSLMQFPIMNSSTIKWIFKVAFEIQTCFYKMNLLFIYAEIASLFELSSKLTNDPSNK